MGRKGGSFVSNESREIREMRDQLIRAVYDLRDSNTGRAMGNATSCVNKLPLEGKFSEVLRDNQGPGR
jgi:hypothetical protein